MKKSLFFLVLIVITASVIAGTPAIHHNLKVFINPENSYIEVTDEVIISHNIHNGHLNFKLNNSLLVMAESFVSELVEDENTPVKLKSYSEDMPADKDYAINLHYKGTIYHPIKESAEEYARSFSQTPGIISKNGVYLCGSSYWIPHFNDNLITFSMTVSLPEDWDAVSQGERTLHEIKDGRRIVRWESTELTEDVHLVAAPFTEYSKKTGNVDVMAFLRTPDEGLANKYLETTGQYLKMYEDLIGPYPYSKFALVENFWETGYGMASFTLLGQQIIRFPFILHSSYPHELLHNWWGNSVYVDYEKGNWCEGITVYMADHLIKEQRGSGADYRRSTLQKYTDFVDKSNDFSLNKFISRFDAASEAVGYGKCMMMWNMLREDVGDEKFIESFRKFYKNNKYKFASFDDIRVAFEEVTGRDLKPFFRQWTERTGAPELSLRTVNVIRKKEKYIVKIEIEQLQDEKPFTLCVPIAVSFDDRTDIVKARLSKRRESVEFTFPKAPLSLTVDPQFNVFRRLHYNEVPPSLSKILGADEILILLPSKADKEHLKNYEDLAGMWAADKNKKIKVKFDSEISELPNDRPVWIFGNENIFSKAVSESLEIYDASLDEHSTELGNTSFSNENNSTVIVVRHPLNAESVAVLLNIENSDAVSGLSRKLLHYGKYSYLVFEGNEPANIAKGTWSAVNSPLTVSFDDLSGRTFPELPKRAALAELEPLFSEKRMMESVKYLSSDELEGRGTGTAGIEKAASFIENHFKKAGLKPFEKDGNYFQSWTGIVDSNEKKGTLKNIIGFIPGNKESMKGEAVVISAHYDHLGYGWPDVKKGNEGKIHPGADDNASGVAVLMELAEVMAKSLKPDRTIIFAAFTGEENGLKGSKHFVENCKWKITSDLNLDTVGRLNGKKLMIINGNSASEWKHIFMGVGYVTGVQAELITEDLDSSDQKSFINAGIPAVQLFSGPHFDYHTPADSVDKIDGEGLVKVAIFTKETVLYLAEREEPFTLPGKTKSSGHSGQAEKKERKASTGSMPDFTFPGPGVKIGGISPESPAEKAGLQIGDIIIRLGENTITNLKNYTAVLKSFSPGDKAELVFIRNGKEKKTEIILGER